MQKTTKQKKYFPQMVLKYSKPAPLCGEVTINAEPNGSWEQYSLPLGNGFFGANIFGRTLTERIQFSEPTIANPNYHAKKIEPRRGAANGGLNSFAELYIDLNHEHPTNYVRSLSLEDACAYVSYSYNGVNYNREMFTSHPNKVFALRFTADRKGALSMTVRPEIPFLGDYTVEEGDGFSKYGTVTADHDALLIEGEMGYYAIKYFGIIKVLHKGGKLTSGDAKITVKAANEVILLFTCDTNYELSEHVFLEEDPKKKLAGRVVDKKSCFDRIDKAAQITFEILKERHIADYRALYSRVQLNIGDTEDRNRFTDELLQAYKEGKRSRYLETLVFQYGRYLLIASSRTRLPANLQGIWNAYGDTPWGAGYWHNINIQMNYWLSGPANLSESFIPYINYAKAYMKFAKGNADYFIKENYPDKYSKDGENGWIVWTGGYVMKIQRLINSNHSGPGTGALTTLLFWDYYDFTRDEDFLKEFAYPALRDMSVLYTKVLVEHDGKYLVRDSASPENKHNGTYYMTTGCAFDQQMVYENFKRTIDAAEILGINDDFIQRIRNYLPNLDPVLIGDSGQIKEYREETTYGSIGEWHHRHISHLLGLYPGTIINDHTPEWLEAAKVTLTNRGNFSHGWSVAHRFLLWARTKMGDQCQLLIDSFIQNNLFDNLWDSYPPFQIDGNFGYTAGVCEMLMQSHVDYIQLLPSIPIEWANGSFEGLVARGNFVVDCVWENSIPCKIKVTARKSGTLNIKLPNELMPKKTDTKNDVFCKEMTAGESLVFEKSNA